MFYMLEVSDQTHDGRSQAPGYGKVEFEYQEKSKLNAPVGIFGQTRPLSNHLVCHKMEVSTWDIIEENQPLIMKRKDSEDRGVSIFIEV